MLEVGVTNTQGKISEPLNYTEARSHFGAWCIVSAPLVSISEAEEIDKLTLSVQAPVLLTDLPTSYRPAFGAEQILGLNLTDAATVDSFWDIITNTEVSRNSSLGP